MPVWIADRLFHAVLRFMLPRRRGLLLSVACPEGRMAVNAFSVIYHLELRNTGIEVAALHTDPGVFDMKRTRPKDGSMEPCRLAGIIAGLAEMPAGTRPLWTVADAGCDAIFQEHIDGMNRAMAMAGRVG
jgi:hypothetical protein